MELRLRDPALVDHRSATRLRDPLNRAGSSLVVGAWLLYELAGCAWRS